MKTIISILFLTLFYLNSLYAYEFVQVDEKMRGCKTASECKIVISPKCFTEGCSPPCGNVYEVGVASVGKKDVEKVRKEVTKREKEECESGLNAGCPECKGAIPVAPDLKNFISDCFSNLCEVSEIGLKRVDDPKVVFEFFERTEQCAPTYFLGIHPDDVRKKLEGMKVKFRLEEISSQGSPCRACGCSIKHTYRLVLDDQKDAERVTNLLHKLLVLPKN
jgi:hypothetical protein